MMLVKCPKCNKEIEVDTTIEKDILKRIEELEKHQKEQDKKIEQLEEKVKLASIGFPVSIFG